MRDTDKDEALDAFKEIVKLLEPLDGDARHRAIGSVAVMYGFADWQWKRTA